MTTVEELGAMSVGQRQIALSKEREYVHVSTLDLDNWDIVLVYKVYGKPIVILCNDGRGWSDWWNYFQTVNVADCNNRQINEEITIQLRLAQEDLIGRKYTYPENAERLEMLRHRVHGQTRILNDNPIWRRQFFREMPGEKL